ncbi:MAG: hypothetical protein D6695_06905 [Planctomycetota bacterium]|nr:MAG: hypothetical protein D6695_06905 [Planctomycetota bacterium]
MNDAGFSSVFEHWCRIHRARVDPAPAGAGLLRSLGVSLIERGMIDAACRLAGVPMHEALRQDLLGFRPGEVDESLESWRVSEFFARAPLDRLTLRHTVGLADRLRETEVSAEERVGDGLPESLEADIRRYGLVHFKLKVVGDDEQVCERLSAVARVVRPGAGDAARFTLDGNEQFESMHELADSLARARAMDADAAWLLERVMWIEQPLPRGRSFDSIACDGITRLGVPCIIDEADDSIDAFVRAVERGYRGVSIKNCKGVFKALINAGRCALSEGRLFQSGEDLTNLPVVALQQDLTTMATIGIASVERNGHHYFAGMAHLSEADASEACTRHPDLYRDGLLQVRDGQISTASVVRARGFGYDGPVDVETWTPAERWSPDVLLDGR